MSDLTLPSEPRPKTLYGTVVFAVLFLSILTLRIWLLHASQHSVSGDEATVGITARHIVTEGDRPLFAYEADYNGGAALTAYIAVVVFDLFGVGEVALKAIPLVFSLIALVIVYLLARAARGERTALLVALLYGTSLSLAKWNFDARGGYAECQVLIPLTLWWLWSRLPTGSLFDVSIVGFLSGFGTYLLQLFLPVGLTCFVVLLIYGPARNRLARIGTFLVGALLGLGPLLWHSANWGAVGFDPQPLLGGVGRLPGTLVSVVTRFLPGFLGYDNFETYPPFRIFPNGIEYGVWLAATGFLLFRAACLRGDDRPPFECVGFLYVCIYLFLFSLHPLAGNSPRYLLFLEPILSILAGFGAADALGRTNPTWVRGATVVLMSLLLGNRAVQFSRLAKDSRIYGPDGLSNPSTADTLIEFMDSRGISRVVTGDWDLGWRIVFKTQERIQVLHNVNNLHQRPPFIVVVDQDSEADRLVLGLLKKRQEPIERYVLSRKAVYTVGMGANAATPTKDPR